MDIRKWLDETVLPEQPPSPHVPNSVGPPILPSPEYPKKPERAPEGRRPRESSTSDSSLLHTRPAHQKLPTIRAAAGIDSNADDSACSDACHPAGESSESSVSSQQYARRRRRKTRLERYEPAAKDVKKRGTQLYRHRKGESSKTKRKSRRKKGDKLGVGPPQSFKAKNVPKDRLTLKPREKLGLFNKGRASSPVKGRGLPDLVFSEMKFLQKHKDQPEAPHHAGLPKKKRKKDHAQAKHEEISAYFTSVRPPLAEKDVNIQAKEGGRRQSLVLDSGHGRERSSLIDNSIPTVELPGKAEYLSLGSRGPRHESGSYVSWSESVRAPRVTPIRAGAGSTTSTGQLDSGHGRQEGLNSGGAHVLHSLVPAPPSVPKRLTDSSHERFAVSSLTPANHRISSSQSVPGRTFSLRPLHLNEQIGRHKMNEARPSPSSIPAAIPAHSVSNLACGYPEHVESGTKSESLSHTKNFDAIQHGPDDIHERSNGRVMVNVDPQTSSSLGKLLQECNSAFDEERRQAATSRRPDNMHMAPSDVLNNVRAAIETSSYKTIRRLPTVRFSDVETYRPLMPNYSAPCIYEQQARQQRMMHQQQANGEGLTQGIFPILDDQVSIGRGEVDYDEQEWRPIPEEPMAYGLDVEILEDFRRSYDVEESEERFNQTDNVVARGFWRPHKLY